MTESNPEFWNIVAVEFPEHSGDQLLDEQNRREIAKKPVFEDEDAIRSRLISASRDARIASYFLYGIGEEESLIAELQRDYDLTEEGSLRAIDMGIGQLSDVTDYGHDEDGEGRAYDQA